MEQTLPSREGGSLSLNSTIAHFCPNGMEQKQHEPGSPLRKALQFYRLRPAIQVPGLGRNVVVLDHEGAKGLLRDSNEVAVLNASAVSGDSIPQPFGTVTWGGSCK